MSQKIKSKIISYMAVFLMQLVFTLPFYAASAYGITISNVNVTRAASNSATIEWTTDVISNGRVDYGKTAYLGYSQRHDDFTVSHKADIFNGIDSGTTYYFAVKSTDLNGTAAVDNNSGSFYTFKTEDITPPPKVTGLKASSTSSNSVFLSWNITIAPDLSHYLIYRDNKLLANSALNSFNDTPLASDKRFNYRVSAVDTRGNEGMLSDTLIALTAPLDRKSVV